MQTWLTYCAESCLFVSLNELKSLFPCGVCSAINTHCPFPYFSKWVITRYRLHISRGGFSLKPFPPKGITVKPHLNLQWLRGEELLAFVGQCSLHSGVCPVSLERLKVCTCEQFITQCSCTYAHAVGHWLWPLSSSCALLLWTFYNIPYILGVSMVNICLWHNG